MDLQAALSSSLSLFQSSHPPRIHLTYPLRSTLSQPFACLSHRHSEGFFFPIPSRSHHRLAHRIKKLASDSSPSAVELSFSVGACPIRLLPSCLLESTLLRILPKLVNNRPLANPVLFQSSFPIHTLSLSTDLSSTPQLPSPSLTHDPCLFFLLVISSAFCFDTRLVWSWLHHESRCKHRQSSKSISYLRMLCTS